MEHNNIKELKSFAEKRDRTLERIKSIREHISESFPPEKLEELRNSELFGSLSSFFKQKYGPAIDKINAVKAFGELRAFVKNTKGGNKEIGLRLLDMFKDFYLTPMDAVASLEKVQEMASKGGQKEKASVRGGQPVPLNYEKKEEDTPVPETPEQRKNRLSKSLHNKAMQFVMEKAMDNYFSRYREEINIDPDLVDLIQKCRTNLREVEDENANVEFPPEIQNKLDELCLLMSEKNNK